MLRPFSSSLLALILMALSLPSRAETQTLTRAQQAYTLGAYSNLLGRYLCEQDQRKYGDYFEDGFQEGLSYCGHSMPSGYWIYRAPYWFVYGQLQRPGALERASLKGKYQQLIARVECPSELSSNRANYGHFDDYGFEAASDYCGQAYPDAYWVWLDPYWYVWRHKNLNAIGFSSQYQKLKARPPLRSSSLMLQIDYAQRNAPWARQVLTNLQRGIVAMENWSALPFPGSNPFLIEERPNFELLGLAGRHKMSLVSPPQGTPWPLLHEMVHIWNVDVEPLWFNEGQANFISYLLMKELDLPFYGQETLEAYIADWELIRGSPEDVPLQGNYTHLPQGKAIAFWKMLYELGGPALIRESFQLGQTQKQLRLSDLRALIHKHTALEPERLLSGWVTRGRYRIAQASDLGPVRYPLP